jgi:hypothetical protein
VIDLPRSALCRLPVCFPRFDRWKLKTATRLPSFRAWRRVYVIGSVLALYLNVFVLIAQFFMKIAALKALAPTQSEPPFLATQVVVMLVFIVLGILATKRFAAQPVHASRL